MSTYEFTWSYDIAGGTVAEIEARVFYEISGTRYHYPAEIELDEIDIYDPEVEVRVGAAISLSDPEVEILVAGEEGELIRRKWVEPDANLKALLSAHIQTPAFQREVIQHALDNEDVDWIAA